MSSGRSNGRQALVEMVKASQAGDRFLVPGALCAPVFGESRDKGPALRVLFALLWFSAEALRGGVIARFQVALAEARVAAGYEKHEKDGPVLSVLECLGNEVCELPSGERIKVFETLDVTRDNGAQLEWVFTEEFVELFVSPPNFAIAAITELTQLKTGLDFLLYLQLRRIWKMRKSAVTLATSDIAAVAGISAEAGFRRVGERTRRSLVRLEEMLGGRVSVTPKKRPGARYVESVVLEVFERD